MIVIVSLLASTVFLDAGTEIEHNLLQRGVRLRNHNSVIVPVRITFV